MRHVEEYQAYASTFVDVAYVVIHTHTHTHKCRVAAKSGEAVHVGCSEPANNDYVLRSR